MNAQQFLTWMRNPGTTSREESAQLDALLDSFPYFQSGHLLYIKNLHNQGSFLYNNQLKTAAAYAVNRKVLYQLITLQAEVKKAGDERRETGSFDSAQDDKIPETQSVVSNNKEKPIVSEEQISVPPQFPPKKFTSNPDEWEAGMLRQLQLLHHWQSKSGDGLQTGDGGQTGDRRRETGVETTVQQSHSEQSSSPQSDIPQPENELPTEEKTTEQKLPDAKEEINTLLYVLVEPGQPEDLAEENEEEILTETTAEENEATQWEIKIAAEESAENETPIAVPSDPVQKEIMVEAIHSTFELEVGDHLPSVEELKPFRLEPVQETVTPALEETIAPAIEEKAVEEVVVPGMELSFSQWLKEVGKSEVGTSEVDKSQVNKSEGNKPEGEPSEIRKAPSELPKTSLSTDVLVEQFIKDEPRIKGKKSGFYNPVNMAKKSVQESDEFITETLARIYAKQGNTVKAVRAYQKLSLKFPEKTAYFAALIEELKRTPNK
jgi:hypothetical protein